MTFSRLAGLGACELTFLTLISLVFADDPPEWLESELLTSLKKAGHQLFDIFLYFFSPSLAIDYSMLIEYLYS